jgi:hypothetical protein
MVDSNVVNSNVPWPMQVWPCGLQFGGIVPWSASAGRRQDSAKGDCLCCMVVGWCQPVPGRDPGGRRVAQLLLVAIIASHSLWWAKDCESSVTSPCGGYGSRRVLKEIITGAGPSGPKYGRLQ